MAGEDDEVAVGEGKPRLGSKQAHREALVPVCHGDLGIGRRRDPEFTGVWFARAVDEAGVPLLAGLLSLRRLWPLRAVA